jgi:hypothetical protein
MLAELVKANGFWWAAQTGGTSVTIPSAPTSSFHALQLTDYRTDGTITWAPFFPDITHVLVQWNSGGRELHCTGNNFGGAPIAISISGIGGFGAHFFIQGNWFHSQTYISIQITQAQSTLIQGNVFESNTIAIYAVITSGSGPSIQNNEFIQNMTRDVFIEDADFVQIQNNTFECYDAIVGVSIRPNFVASIEISGAGKTFNIMGNLLRNNRGDGTPKGLAIVISAGSDKYLVINNTMEGYAAPQLVDPGAVALSNVSNNFILDFDES